MYKILSQTRDWRSLDNQVINWLFSSEDGIILIFSILLHPDWFKYKPKLFRLRLLDNPDINNFVKHLGFNVNMISVNDHLNKSYFNFGEVRINKKIFGNNIRDNIVKCYYEFLR